MAGFDYPLRGEVAYREVSMEEIREVPRLCYPQPEKESGQFSLSAREWLSVRPARKIPGR